MAKGSKVLKVKLEISDTDRNCYQSLERSLVLHPSESPERLLARLLAYGLEFEPQLEFGRGLSNTDEAPIWLRDLDGRVLHWIDIGQPDSERLSKLHRRCDRVSLYCYGANAGNWWQQHQKDFAKLTGVRVYQLPWPVLTRLSGEIRNGFSLQVIRNDGVLYLVLNGEQAETELVCWQGD